MEQDSVNISSAAPVADCAHDQASPQARVAAIEAGIRRAAAIFQDVPVMETTIVRLVVLLGRDLSAMLEETLGPKGLNETEYRTLIMLSSLPNGVAYPSELCVSVTQSPANMTRIADGLHDRGLISRVPSDEDRRRTILRITPAGEALVRELLPVTTACTRELFSQMPVEGREQLLRQLRALLERVDACGQQAARHGAAL